MYQIASGGLTDTTNDCQKGESCLSSVGYQSSSNYLALPDTLRASFRSSGGVVNVKQAPASDFHAWISRIVEEIDSVNTAVWPIHLRWRVINACLASGLLRLSEVPEGYLIEEVEVPETGAEVEHTPDDAA